MENEQGATQVAELAPETPATTEVSDVSAVQPEVEIKKEYVSTEPRHPLQDVLDKAAKKAEEAKKAVPAEGKKTEALGEVKPAESFEYSKWDGNVTTLPDKLKKIVNDNQTAFHDKAKEAATFKQQYDDLQGKVNSYLQQIEQQKQAQPLFTQEEFESAQLNPEKFLELTQRVAKNIVDAEKAQIAPILSKLEFDRSVVENERVINDFASKNKNFWQLYDAGILEPLVEKYGLESGYSKASEILSKIQNQATTASQGRVLEKKGSVSAKPTNAQSIEVAYVDRPEEVLQTAMRYAAEGKHVKVKVRQR